MLEVGKQYIIEARFKKRVTEVEFFEKDDNEILVDTVWRNAEFRVEMHEDDVEYIQKFIDLDEESFDEFSLDALTGYFEMESTWDGCSMDLSRGDWTEELVEQVQEDEEPYYVYLEENGWDQTDTQYYVNGPIDIREVESREM
jgi:hypothetical protein